MNKFSTPKIIIFFVFLLLTSLIYSVSINFFDAKVNDVFIKFETNIINKKPSDNVVLVVIDNESLSKIDWPWTRNIYSDIFDFLEYEAKAKTIVFQIPVIFSDTYNVEKDKYFFNNLLNHEILINSYIPLNSNVAGDILNHKYLSLFDKKTNVELIDKRSKTSLNSFKSVINLPKDFIHSVKILAASHIPEDSDTVVRSYMPVVQMNNKLYPSLALSAYAMYTGQHTFELYDDKICSIDECKTLKMSVISGKVNDYLGNSISAVLSYYKWYKPIDNYYSHKSYSAIDIIDSYNLLKEGKQPKINPDIFKDKIVIIGINADKNAWEQLSETPVLKRQADIDVHATMIDNLLSNSFSGVKLHNHNLAITVILSLLIILGFKNFKTNIIFASILCVIYLIYYIVMYFMNMYVPPFTPILIMFVCCVLKKVFVIITTDKTSEAIKLAMGKYLPKGVLKQILSNIDKLKPGGVRAVVTVLFVDIRNFTQMSEELSPSDITSVLNEYFSTIAPIIGKYHGIINKYMGDGLLAVFGEPIKTNTHAQDAILCGMEIIQKVKNLREKLLNEGKPRIAVGIGVNTGEVFAGNIGTDERLEYTVIGDNVNLASRIESFNHILKTQFLISEYTYEYVKDLVEVVKLSKVSIRGKSKPIDIYEVLDIKKND